MASLLGGGGREYVLKIVADVKDAIKGVDDVASKTTSMKDKMIGIGKGVAAGLATAAVVEFGRQSIQAAADADDAMDAVESAFGAGGQSVIDFSKTTAESMGLSSQDYQTMAAETGRILTGFGIANEDAADQTNTLATRAADMAAIVGGTTSDAMAEIDKAMQGQTRGLKKYGISISNAEVEARAMAKGYVDASGKVTDAGKAIATQELILQKTAQYQGEFARNSGDLGSQQEILKAKFENLQTTLGQKLLPILLQVMQAVQPLFNFLAENIQWIAPLAGIIAGIAAAVKIWTIAQAAFNVVMAANPIILVAAAIAGLVAGIIIAYQKVEWFRDAVDAMGRAVVAAFNWIKDAAVAVFNWIKQNWPLLLAILTGPFGAAIAIIIKNWDTIKGWLTTFLEWIRNLFSGLGSKIAAAVSNVLGIIKQPFESAWNFIQTIPDKIVSGFRTMVNGIKNVLSGLADAIKRPFELAFNGIKTLWNNTIGKLSFTVPSWVPGIGGKGWSAPRLAQGGIVTRPTIALIGEAGPEAVIPLSGSNAVMVAQPTVVNINVYALTPTAEVGRKVYEALREYERITGQRLAS